MNNKVTLQVVCYPSSQHASLLSLFKLDEEGQSRLLVTTSPIPRVAARALSQAFEGTLETQANLEALKKVLQIPGKTAWASFTAFDAAKAAWKACLQHDLNCARGVLILITFPSGPSTSNDLESVLDVVLPCIPAAGSRAWVRCCEETLNEGVRVGVLLTGVGPRAYSNV